MSTPSDFAILAMIQSMLGGSSAQEERFLLNELARRLILNGMTVNAAGTISLGPFTFTPAGPWSIANGGTNSGTALSGSSIMISNGTQIAQGPAGTATTVLHGNAAGAPTYSAVVEGDLSTSDLTTADVTSTKHGFAPKSPATATTFLNGAATPAYAAVKDSDLSTTDITTNDVSTAKHGFTPKLPNDASKFLNGMGAYAVPANPCICNGRLTLTTALPVTISDVAAAPTVFFTPYGGNQIATYSGSVWSVSTFTEKSVAVPAVGNQMYDVFIVDGTLALEVLAWTNDTTRATALALQDGVWVKSGVTTRRYLGSFRTLTASQTEDSFSKRLLWNYYNRMPRALRVVDTSDTWSYTTAAFRQANGSAANQLAVVVGVQEVELFASVSASYRNTNAAVAGSVSIGEDSTSVASAGVMMNYTASQVAAQIVHSTASLRRYPAVGYHFYPWLEYSEATGTTTWLGDGGVGYLQSGISGSIHG